MKPFSRVRITVAGVAVAWLLAVVSAQAANASPVGAPCTRSEIPAPGWSNYSAIQAVDPSGRYLAGTARDADERTHLLRWDNGELTDLVTISGYGLWIADVNGNGEITGGDYDAGKGGYFAWRYRDGELEQLPTQPPYTQAYPSAVNDAGQIAGTLDNPETGESLAVVWSADNELTVLARPSHVNRAAAADIDEDGTVLGGVYHDDGNTNIRDRSAIVWDPDGTWRLLRGLEPDVETGAGSIRFGQAIGSQVDGPGSVLLWDAKTGVVSPFRDGVKGRLGGINATGSVFGLVDYAEGPVFLKGGTTETRPLPINDPLMGSGWPAGLTDDDVLYGNDYRDDGTSELVRWDCRG